MIKSRIKDYSGYQMFIEKYIDEESEIDEEDGSK